MVTLKNKEHCWSFLKQFERYRFHGDETTGEKTNSAFGATAVQVSEGGGLAVNIQLMISGEGRHN